LKLSFRIKKVGLSDRKLLAPQLGSESCQPNEDTSVKAECANDNTTANSYKKSRTWSGEKA
jgi:hypothetical protein